jgi:hypothetical protein
MAKCKGGFKMNKEGKCVRTKQSKRAETAGRVLAGVLTWGASEGILHAGKKMQAKRDAKKKKSTGGNKYAAKSKKK